MSELALNDPKFIHLRVHTEFSLVDGLVRVKELVAAAKADNMPAVAMTDQTNLFALIKFFKATTGSGLKPICGADLWVENTDEPGGEPYRLTFLVRNSEGYLNLMELISQAYAEGQNIIHDMALVKKEWIVEKSAGLIVLSGAKRGEIGRSILSENGQAGEILQYWMGVFPDAFYLEVQRTGRSGDEQVVHGSVALAKQYNCPIVATNEVMFIRPEDFEAHEVRVCINQGVRSKIRPGLKITARSSIFVHRRRWLSCLAISPRQ